MKCFSTWGFVYAWQTSIKLVLVQSLTQVLQSEFHSSGCGNVLRGRRENKIPRCVQSVQGHLVAVGKCFNFVFFSICPGFSFHFGKDRAHEFWGVSLPTSKILIQHRTEATPYLWRAHSTIWDNCTWRWVCDCGAGPAAVGVRGFSCASGTEGGVFGRTLLRERLCLLPRKGSALTVCTHWWTTQGDLKLSPTVWNILNSLISLLGGLIAVVPGLFFFLFTSWIMFSPIKLVRGLEAVL